MPINELVWCLHKDEVGFNIPNHVSCCLLKNIRQRCLGCSFCRCGGGGGDGQQRKHLVESCCRTAELAACAQPADYLESAAANARTMQAHTKQAANTNTQMAAHNPNALGLPVCLSGCNFGSTSWLLLLPIRAS